MNRVVRFVGCLPLVHKFVGQGLAYDSMHSSRFRGVLGSNLPRIPREKCRHNSDSRVLCCSQQGDWPYGSTVVSHEEHNPSYGALRHPHTAQGRRGQPQAAAYHGAPCPFPACPAGATARACMHMLQPVHGSWAAKPVPAAIRVCRLVPERCITLPGLTATIFSSLGPPARPQSSMHGSMCRKLLAPHSSHVDPSRQTHGPEAPAELGSASQLSERIE